FYARDVRAGLGERKTFRVILEWLAQNSPSTVSKNISLIPEYGRFDDLLSLIGTPCESSAIEAISSQLKADITADSPSLLAKWLPSVNASSPETRRKAIAVAKGLGLSLRDYRRTLTDLRARLRLIENDLRTGNYTFDYSKQPSRAMLKYRQAFIRNDGERYSAFLDDVASGKTELHTGTLAPYDVIMPIFTRGEMDDDERKSLNAAWNALEDFTRGENSLAVVDCSGSMYGGRTVYPVAAAVSLGIYFAEHNTGEYHNHFITFSAAPRLIEIKGSDIFEKVNYCATFNQAENTNLQAVFELILNTAVKHKVPQSELPSTLYIVSDMEFDYCTVNSGMTNFEYAKKIFADNGYTLPSVVFWNVDSRNEQQPVTMNEQGVALVSGTSPRIFSMLKAGDFSPMSFMLDVMNSPRYKDITA
ncbi:MAG: DUF2828 family protein, partial [Synergistaceae bacterium]|nr:DUF2828 family protein [Synergistaceae bacterium]